MSDYRSLWPAAKAISVGIAAALAGDRARVARLHTELPARLRDSSIMDEAGFVRGLEQAYREMHLRARSAR
jgi:predicted O-linked N-acetylglucosamine transferase (SPINDLY family)